MKKTKQFDSNNKTFRVNQPKTQISLVPNAHDQLTATASAGVKAATTKTNSAKAKLNAATAKEKP